MVKIAHLDDASSECFELEASAVEGQSLQQKDNKRRKEKAKKKLKKKRKSLKMYLISTHAQEKMSLNAMLVERKPCCHVANAFFSRLELIWPITSLQVSKMSKECVF